MPLYDYKCGHCSRNFELFERMSAPAPHCPACGAQLKKQLSAPYVRSDSHIAYKCPITGARIEGLRQHRENLARHGCRILEPGEVTQHKHRLAEGERKLDASIEATTDRLIAGLPTEKRDRLAAEMEQGLTTTIERRTFQPGT